MGQTWYYTRGGQQAGPVGLAELRQMLASGQVGAHELVWSEGMPQWLAAASVAELAPLGGAAPQPTYPAAVAPGAAQLGYFSPATHAPVYAGFWLRFVAAIVDGLILAVIGFVIGVIGGVLMRASGATGQDAETIFGSILQLISIVINWLYFALQESGPRQATLGKRLLGIQVTDLYGQRISFGRATGRYFGKIISAIILLIGYIMAAFTEKKQALHDIMAGCLVVKTGPVRVA